MEGRANWVDGGVCNIEFRVLIEEVVSFRLYLDFSHAIALLKASLLKAGSASRPVAMVLSKCPCRIHVVGHPIGCILLHFG